MRVIITRLLILVLVVGGCLIAPTLVSADSSYGSGTYGSCQYNTCGISLTSSGTVSLGVTPGAGTTCTTASDTVSVLTDSSTGYSLTMNDGDTAAVMDNGSGGTIATTSGSSAAPATLIANTWGYRVDSLAGFGAGPTNASANSGVPSVQFAAVPISSAAADTLATSAVAANPAVTTTVWYGLCVNASKPTGTYNDTVVYTAVVN